MSHIVITHGVGSMRRGRFAAVTAWVALGVAVSAVEAAADADTLPGMPRLNRVLLEASAANVGSHGDAVSAVSKPSYVLATGGRVYVSEFWKNRVVQIQTSGSGSGGSSGKATATVFAEGGGLDGPWGLASHHGVLFVASFATDRIHRYNLSTGADLGLFGSENELDCPEGITVDPQNGTVFVASFLNDSISMYDSGGTFLGALAPPGLSGPEDVAVLPGGDLVVTSHHSGEIVWCRPDGSAPPRTVATVENPVGLTVGPDGNVYVASYTKHAVVRYDTVTGDTTVFATGGYLQGPSSLSFASARLLYVTSYENDRVVLYNATTRVSVNVPFGGARRRRRLVRE